MAYTRRTKQQIELDCNRIKEAAQTATSIEELKIATGLSYSMINTTLAKHPIIEKRVKAMLEVNSENAKKASGRKCASTHDEFKLTLKCNEAYNKHEQIVAAGNTAPDSNAQTVTESPNTNKPSLGYVLDASITGHEGLNTFLSMTCATNSKIILTSVTLKELDRMQCFSDIQANHARFILALAAENPASFKTVLIDEENVLPDDAIIAYCHAHKDEVVLLTCDKLMALKARMYGVSAKYYAPASSAHRTHSSNQNDHSRFNKYSIFANRSDFDNRSNLTRHSGFTRNSIQSKQQSSASTFNSNTSGNQNFRKYNTLTMARPYCGKLIISDFETPVRSIAIYSGEDVYTSGTHELKIGDDILVATKKSCFMTFVHLRVVSLSTNHNAELVFSKRIYFDEKMPIRNPKYLDFINDFSKKHGITFM